MIWVRKGLVHLLSVILLASLLGSVAALTFDRVLGTPNKVKTVVAQSGVYDKVISSALNQAETDSQKDGGDSSVPLNDPTVQKAAQEAFSPQFLRQSFETFIDANYAWLQGKTGIPQFNIDLSGAKNSFAEKVGTAVTARLQGLPACTSDQMAKLQLPVDDFTVACRPTSLDPQSEGTRITQDLKNSQDFLGQPVLTPDNLNQNGQDQSAPGKPYYRSASRLPQVFQWLQKGPLLLGLLALATAAGIIFVAPTKRRGWRRNGWVFVLAGLILIGAKLAADKAADTLSRQLHKGTANQFGDQVNSLVRHVEQQLSQFNLQFGIAFVVVGLAILIWLFKTREGAGKPKASKAEPPVAPTADESVAEESPDLLGFEAAEADEAKETSPATPPRQTTKTAPPLKSADQVPKIKKPRPPRLIQ